ncbi:MULTISPECIES: P-type conjugative transfer protein TrbL [unclassified Campylobacter]|uniref:P-type conjugative transfer protein TrbL n=1 Tax=unclassified Campylobacter TaxID=2593542 RepID=UPI0030143824
MLLIPNIVLGATNVPGSDSILNELKSNISSWLPNIKRVCIYVFYSLAVIDIVWTFSEKALKGFELGDFLAALIKKIIYIGIFLFLFNTDLWIKTLYTGFQQLATNVTYINVTPSTILDKAFSIVGAIFKSMSLVSPGDSFLKIIIGVIVLAAFCLMAIDLLIVYLKFYLLNIICYFAFALGGLSHFKQLGLNPVLAAIKIGIELFLISAFMGLCVNFMIDLIDENIDFDYLMSILAMALIFCIITKMIPGMIESVMNGSIGETAGASASFRAVTATAAGIATGVAIGGVSKTISALNEANKLNNITGANEGKGKVGKLRNAFKTAYSETKEQFKANFGKSQVSESLREKTKEVQEAIKKAEGTISGDKNNNTNENYASGVEK